MCGINGLFATGNQLPSNAEALISGMNNSIVHRGPDDGGVYVNHDSGIALGHRRLSIIDLTSAGHQPMYDNQKNYIVYNGEIYNYKKIKSELKTIQFKSSTDTEVLLHLLNKKGITSLDELNGMFAFCWFNQKNNTITLARDRAGKKPVYYTESNGIFAFSSEIKALLTLPWVKSIPDDHAVYNFLTFNQLDAPQTMFKGINKLAPAEYLVVNKKGIAENNSWWKLKYDNLNNSDFTELTNSVYDTLKNSVNDRMVADVPVGAFLSGGVDSSAVVALMRQFSNSTIKTYSIGFENQPDYDERKYAEKVSAQFKTEHIERIVSADEIAAYLPEITGVFDEPLADTTCIPIHFISQLARENGTIVVQTGDGADELFAGYRNWQKYEKVYPWFHYFSSFPKALKQPSSILTKFLPEASPVAEMIHRGINNEELFWGGAKSFKENNKRDFLNAEFLASTCKINSYDVIKKHHLKFLDYKNKYPYLNDVDWMCYLGFHFQIPNKYLHRMDKLGMANSIEIRSPFLDYRMISLAMSIPSIHKIKNGEPKYILKKSLERILPKEILYRKKMGFCVPLKEWTGEIMFDYINAHAGSFCDQYQIFNKKGLQQQLKEYQNGNKNLTNNLWTVFFLMSWFNKWIK